MIGPMLLEVRHGHILSNVFEREPDLTIDQWSDRGRKVSSTEDQRAYWSMTPSIARAQTGQNPTGSRVNMMQSIAGR